MKYALYEVTHKTDYFETTQWFIPKLTDTEFFKYDLEDMKMAGYKIKLIGKYETKQEAKEEEMKLIRK